MSRRIDKTSLHCVRFPSITFRGLGLGHVGVGQQCERVKLWELSVVNSRGRGQLTCGDRDTGTQGHSLTGTQGHNYAERQGIKQPGMESGNQGIRESGNLYFQSLIGTESSFVVATLRAVLRSEE